MSMDMEELEQLLEEVGRFASARIADLTVRPETPIAPTLLVQLTQEAVDLGILPASTAEEGFSIWEHCDNSSAMAFNIGALRCIAHASPGIAFAWHRMAMVRFVAIQLGLTLDPGELQGTLLAPTGHYGLARSSLARWLSEVECQNEDANLLTDWFDRRGNATLYEAKK